MASNYPANLDNFVTNLNYKQDYNIVTNEALSFLTYDTNYNRARLIHDNAESIVVKEGTVVKTLNTDYTIVADTSKPWITYIQRNKSISASWTVSYNTKGDETDADDVNGLQDSVAAIQSTLGTNPQGTKADVAERLSDIENGKTTRVNLTGQIQLNDYRRSVIALCQVGIENSYSAGTITFHRVNGLSGVSVLDFAMEKRYSETKVNYSGLLRSNNSIFTGSLVVKSCTFVYNGITYGGLDIYIDPACSAYVEFNGVTNFNIFGLDYYNTQTSTPINTEINSSINYANVVKYQKMYLNESLIWHDGNDGAGSGLDADKFEGQEGTYYLNYNNFTNKPTITEDVYVVPTGGIASKASITIPNSRTYTVGSKELKIIRDGFEQVIDSSSTAYDNDYWEVSATQVRFNYALPEGSIVKFRITNL
jgi:hypothetical protein